MNKVLEGFKFGFGIILCLCLFFGIVFAIGFHSAEEILGGNFTGDFIFENNVTFNGKVNGINSGGFTNLVGYDTPGNYNFTIPEGVTKIRITAAGAGGGGGGSGGTYGLQGTYGGDTKVFGIGVNIVALGGEGGYGRGLSGGSDASKMNSATGGDLNLKGKGAEGGGAAIHSYDQTGTEGRNGGLAIKTISVTDGTNYSVTIGAGGAGTTGAYGTGETGADGYVIIEY